jgi:hypothetical protein
MFLEIIYVSSLKYKATKNFILLAKETISSVLVYKLKRDRKETASRTDRRRMMICFAKGRQRERKCF